MSDTTSASKRPLLDSEDGASAYEKIAKLWADEKFADATVHCNGSVWHVHKGVLCLNSKYFAKAFEGHFKEAEEAKIDFPEEEPTVVGQILEWIYLSDYTVIAESNVAVQNAKLYAAADKYGLPRLQASALARFINSLPTSSSLSELTLVIYNGPGDFKLLRKPLIVHLRQQMTEILKDAEFVALLTTVQSLAYDLLNTGADSVKSLALEPSEDEQEPTCNGRCKGGWGKKAHRCGRCGRRRIWDLFED